MTRNTVYEFIDVLAEQHIPEGKHKLLHVDSRRAWIELMNALVERGLVAKKLAVLKKCALNWELLLIQKISIQN